MTAVVNTELVGDIELKDDRVITTMDTDDLIIRGDVKVGSVSMAETVQQITTNSNKITANEMAIAANTQAIGQVQTDIAATNQTVAQMQDSVTANSQAIGQMQDSVTANSQAIGQAQSAITQAQTDIQANTQAIAQNTASISKIKVNTDAIETNKVNIDKNANDIAVNKTAIEMNAANIQQNSSAITGLNQSVISLDSRLDKVGAGAAALAALHPLDYDPDDKLTFSAGVGNYAGATAAAIGAFYRPNEDVMFSIGGAAGNGENMVNMGISFALGKGGEFAKMSRQELIRKVKTMEEKYEFVEAQNRTMQTKLENENQELKAEN